MSVWRQDGHALLLSVRLTPRAAREALGGHFTDADGRHWLSVSVSAPPDKGRANAALIERMAKALKVPSSSISLEAGDTSRLKRLRLARFDSATLEALDRLAGVT